jgi:hypothetical protein
VWTAACWGNAEHESRFEALHLALIAAQADAILGVVISSDLCL